MQLSRVFTRLFCIPFTCALVLMAVATSATFASTTQQHVDVSKCPSLSRGDTDSSMQGLNGPVAILQQRLRLADPQVNLGKTGPKQDGIDGDFGGLTEKAVTSFQSTHKDENGQPLKQDGVVGKHTWFALGGCDAPAQQPGQPSNPAPAPILCTATNLDAGKVVTTSGGDVPEGKQYTVKADNNLSVRGCVTLTFSAKVHAVINNISLAVKDISGDSHPVDIKLRIKDSYHHDLYELPNNQLSLVNDKGYDKPALDKTFPSYTNEFNVPKTVGLTKYDILGVEVRACVQHTATCATYYIDNPYI